MIEAGVDMWLPQDINDVDMLREKYGDKLMLGVAPAVAPDATDEEIDALAKAFAEKYAPGMKERPILLTDFACGPKFSNLVYKYSRIILSGE